MNLLCFLPAVLHHAEKSWGPWLGSLPVGRCGCLLGARSKPSSSGTFLQGWYSHDDHPGGSSGIALVCPSPFSAERQHFRCHLKRDSPFPQSMGDAVANAAGGAARACCRFMFGLVPARTPEPFPQFPPRVYTACSYQGSFCPGAGLSICPCSFA